MKGNDANHSQLPLPLEADPIRIGSIARDPEGRSGLVVDLCTPVPTTSTGRWAELHPFDYPTQTGDYLADVMTDAGAFVTEPLAKIQWLPYSWSWVMQRQLTIMEESV